MSNENKCVKPDCPLIGENVTSVDEPDEDIDLKMG